MCPALLFTPRISNLHRKRYERGRCATLQLLAHGAIYSDEFFSIVGFAVAAQIADGAAAALAGSRSTHTASMVRTDCPRQADTVSAEGGCACLGHGARVTTDKQYRTGAAAPDFSEDIRTGWQSTQCVEGTGRAVALEFVDF